MKKAINILLSISCALIIFFTVLIVVAIVGGGPALGFSLPTASAVAGGYAVYHIRKEKQAEKTVESSVNNQESIASTVVKYIPPKPKEEQKQEPKIKVDYAQILKDEENWRREQRGLSPIEYELYKIDNMTGHEFEHWCAKLLERNGFSEVHVTPGSNDQGVDVLAEKDEIKYAIQCKCYSSDLGNTPVQEVSAGKELYHCQVGVVMTNRHFTKGAIELAAATKTLLWDRSKIIKMME